MGKKDFFAVILLFNCFFVLLFFAGRNEYCEGGADNYWHYFFSKYAFEYPQYFLHHWGKPVFILLSSPFAQLGLSGLKFFNIICGILTAIVCYLFCRDAGFKLSWFVIPLLIFTPVYFLLIQSAMTEPLFGLLIILTSYLFFKESFLTGSLVASLFLFSRTEGAFIILFYAAYLIYIKRWKYLPLLGTAFIIYAFAGLFSGHKFFWFFTEVPYKAESPYGHGEWNHFFKMYDVIFGTPHTILLLCGFILLLVALIKNKEYKVFTSPGIHAKIFLLVFIPGLFYFFFHVISWRYGKFGSAGLERVMASAMPCFAIISMYAVNAAASLKIPKWIIYAAALAGISAS